MPTTRVRPRLSRWLRWCLARGIDLTASGNHQSHPVINGDEVLERWRLYSTESTASLESTLSTPNGVQPGCAMIPAGATSELEGGMHRLSARFIRATACGELAFVKVLTVLNLVLSVFGQTYNVDEEHRRSFSRGPGVAPRREHASLFSTRTRQDKL